jgi:hypothetical protein
VVESGWALESTWLPVDRAWVSSDCAVFHFIRHIL